MEACRSDFPLVELFAPPFSIEKRAERSRNNQQEFLTQLLDLVLLTYMM